jgi:hypothetical protein
MNSGGWYIFLFCFIFGVVCQSVTTLGIWQVSLPNAQNSVTIQQINQTEKAAQDSPLSIFVIYSWIVMFVTVITAGLISSVSVALYLYGLGWPVGVVGSAIIQILQLPADLVLFYWVFELLTGH